MKKNRSDLSLGEMKELVCAMGQATPTDLQPELVRYWNGHKKEMAAKIRKALLSINSYTAIIAEWEAFYAELGIKCDFSGVKIPDDPGGFPRVIIMAQGITPQSAYNLCAKNFKCWKWTEKNLDTIVESERTTKDGPYAIRIRDRVEADKENKNLSHNKLKEMGIKGITLEEREIFELKYHKETNKHLDIHNWTLCAGSRYSGGGVPRVGWDGCYGGMGVSWCSPEGADDRLRSRSAVTLLT